jgi:hypothetical protein
MVNSSLRHASEKSLLARPRRQAFVEGWMHSRLLVAVIAVGVSGWSATNVSAGQGPGSEATFKIPASTYAPPKTPWGDPDLQGVWDNHTVVPMQRPANLAGKKTFTDAELAARAKARASNDPLCNQNDERCAIATVAELV